MKCFYIFLKYSVKIRNSGEDVTLNVPGNVRPTMCRSKFIHTNYQSHLLSEIIQSYAIGDICLIGAKGSGKSILVSRIAHLLNQSIEPMVLYQDMTARDFLQQRSTTPTGDTIWNDSPLIRAAKNGTIAVLDGIHRLHSSTLAILFRYHILHIRYRPSFSSKFGVFRRISSCKYLCLFRTHI